MSESCQPCAISSHARMAVTVCAVGKGCKWWSPVVLSHAFRLNFLHQPTYFFTISYVTLSFGGPTNTGTAGII
jgi:hypothetical protein